MPNYKPIIDNGKVTDVLCLVVAGYSIKDMVKKLKQPQSTVSEKIRFLIKSNVIKKDKWKFEPKWKVITKLFQKSIKDWFKRNLKINIMVNTINKTEGIGTDEKVIVEINDMIRRIPEVFNEERVFGMMSVYSHDMINRPKVKKMSIRELAKNYIETMEYMPLEELGSLRNDIREVKIFVDKIKTRKIDQIFFERVERQLAKINS